MAMILSELHKLDTKKIVKMTLLHDLVESVVGDFTPEEISKPKKLELEKKLAQNQLVKRVLKQKVKNQKMKVSRRMIRV